MDKFRRNERMSAMLKILSDHPNRIYTLTYFCGLFNAAKSTLSEDIDLLQKTIEDFGLGRLETVTGAAGGVRYRMRVKPEEALRDVRAMCEELSGEARVLPGGFLFCSDLLAEPEPVRRMGEIIAARYYEANPDFVLTMETKGIPVAMETARGLGVPLVIARRSSKVYEGPAVNINYVSASSGSIQNMSLNRRAVKAGQRCLVVDDFLKGGGTAKGMMDLMREFDVTVAGMMFVIATEQDADRRLPNTDSLMTFRLEGDRALVSPAAWLKNAARIAAAR